MPTSKLMMTTRCGHHSSRGHLALCMGLEVYLEEQVSKQKPEAAGRCGGGAVGTGEKKGPRFLAIRTVVQRTQYRQDGELVRNSPRPLQLLPLRLRNAFKQNLQ